MSVCGALSDEVFHKVRDRLRPFALSVDFNSGQQFLVVPGRVCGPIYHHYVAPAETDPPQKMHHVQVRSWKRVSETKEPIGVSHCTPCVSPNSEDGLVLEEAGFPEGRR